MPANKDLLNAPILPSKGAAGVMLSATTIAIKKHWGEPLRIEQIRPDYVWWEYRNEVFFFEHDKLTQIRLRDLYSGQTKEGIKLGSTTEEGEAV